MRKLCVLLAALILCMLCACGGEVSGVKLDVGEIELYSEAEIRAAMYVVADYFEQNFDGCELQTLTYDEDFSSKRADGWAKQYKAEQAIVLSSSFYVRPDGGNGSLEPDETYENWQWVLTRSGPDDWELQTWGYG